MALGSSRRKVNSDDLCVRGRNMQGVVANQDDFLLVLRGKIDFWLGRVRFSGAKLELTPLWALFGRSVSSYIFR